MPVRISKPSLAAFAPAGLVEPSGDWAPLSSAGANSRIMPFTAAERTKAWYRLIFPEETINDGNTQSYHDSNCGDLYDACQECC